ncbi:MAG TPA: response regulator [Myxococcota bacterium]|nr:response regulator [Myxococcota bacterium]
MRILLADDDEFFLKTTEDTLVAAGHEVFTATTGEEAVEKTISKLPDLAIIDIILPGLLGTEVARKLRNYSRTAPIPVILVSIGVAEIEEAGGDPQQFLADDFLHKPIEPQVLLDHVRRLGKQREIVAARGRDRPPRPAPGVDRRGTPRLPIDVEVTSQTAEVLLHHPMINISTGGIYFEIERNFLKGSIVDLHFLIPGGIGDIQASGEVAWCLEIEHDLRWGVGIRFSEIEAPSLRKIERYVRALLGFVKPNGGNRVAED